MADRAGAAGADAVPGGVTSADDTANAARRAWSSGWRRYLFPSIWLFYLAQTVGGIAQHSSGVVAVAGYALVGLFAVGYALCLPAGWSGATVRFRTLFAGMFVASLLLIPIAHEDAFVTWVYIGVLLVAGFRRQAGAAIAALTVVAVVLPALIPSWHAGLDWDMFFTIPLVGLAMYGFFSLVDTNRALAEARTEVARLAAENERTRIARDLHDLLGHSLTTITVKAGLARKLAERETADGADSRTAREIAEVEAVARRSLSEVRAAVSGFHEVSLAGELATAREVLRAATIDVVVPPVAGVVDPLRSELFGWVVREGVTNVVRHARAHRCAIAVGPTWLEITDDGFGIIAPGSLDPGADDGAGHGLRGLQERIEAAGGTLVSGRVPGGWRIRAELPEPLAATARADAATRPVVTDRDLFVPPVRP